MILLHLIQNKQRRGLSPVATSSICDLNAGPSDTERKAGGGRVKPLLYESYEAPCSGFQSSIFSRSSLLSSITLPMASSQVSTVAPDWGSPFPGVTCWLKATPYLAYASTGSLRSALPDNWCSYVIREVKRFLLVGGGAGRHCLPYMLEPIPSA